MDSRYRYLSILVSGRFHDRLSLFKTFHQTLVSRYDVIRDDRGEPRSLSSVPRSHQLGNHCKRVDRNCTRLYNACNRDVGSHLDPVAGSIDDARANATVASLIRYSTLDSAEIVKLDLSQPSAKLN
jgi:hypothetical protein